MSGNSVFCGDKEPFNVYTTLFRDDGTTFDQLIDQYIDRAAQDEADVPAETIFDLLAQRLSQRVDEPVTLLVDVENHDLTLRTEQAVPDVVVHGNELIVGNHRFILQLATPPEPLPVSA